MTDTVILERPATGVAVVRINRPEVRNALNLEVRRHLAKLFHDFVDDKTLRCVVLTGNEKSFAAGADILDMSLINVRRHPDRRV